MDKEFLQILACPACLGSLDLLEAGGAEEGLLCPRCAKVYPMREEIPVMLKEEAVPYADWQAGLRGPAGRGKP